MMQSMYYQSSSEVQADGDGLQTLYLMNPNYDVVDTTTTTQPNSMLFLVNPTSTSSSAAPHPHHFVGIPLSHQDPITALHNNSTRGLVDHQSENDQNHEPQQTPRRHLSLSLSAHHQSGDCGFPAVQIFSPTTDSIDGVNTMKSVIMGSKYLKAAQELLDEVVNVVHAKTHRPDKAKISKQSDKSRGGGGGDPELISLTTAQRQEIQMKRTKLNSMLDEVEQRCRQYDEQMQKIVASLEHAAGIGSAKSYTQVALKTILNQFGCLKSTICAQIKGMNKISLGEEDQKVDHRAALRQNINAWRPQRGLPERAVSVLRAWLFEHFLHPYPKDSDKQMLAKQTGLTKSQVSNWFINARVRLWKPMVEEMYIEETKNNEIKIPIDNKTPTTTAPPPPPPPSRSIAQLISSLNMPENSPKKARFLSADESETAMKRFSNNNSINNVKYFSTHENYLSMANMNRYGADQQVAPGNGFSLSLALPPIDDQSQHMSFLSHRNFEFVDGGGINIDEGGGAGAASSHPNIAGYEILNFQSRKSFPPQLLPDFVA